MADNVPDPHLHPVVADGLATAHVDGGVVIANRVLREPLRLSPFEATLLDLMDGTASVADLADDVAAVLELADDAALHNVQQLVSTLGRWGMLKNVPTSEQPHIEHPPFDPTTCLGKRLGYGRATVITVADEQGTGRFRIASTDAALLEPLRDHAVEGGEETMETLALRITHSPTGLPRLQALYNSLGDPMFADRDLDRVTEAFYRTADSLISAPPRPRLNGPLLVIGNRAILVHPSLRTTIGLHLRTRLAEAGVSIAPAGLARVVDGTSIELPSDRWHDRPAVPLELIGVVTPTEPELRSHLLALLLDSFPTWDQSSLTAAEHLSSKIFAIALGHSDVRSFLETLVRVAGSADN